MVWVGWVCGFAGPVIVEENKMIIIWPWDTPRAAITPPYKRDLETGGYTKRYRTVDQLKKALEIIAKAKGVKVPWKE